MIFAHSKTLGRTADNSVTEFFWYLGFFAPVLFFASVGVSLMYQLKKRNVLTVLLFYLILFTISFADRGRESLNYINFSQPNLIGSIAIAAMIGALTLKFNGLVVFTLFIVGDRVLNKFQMPPSIIYGVPFAIFPWAGLVSLGQFMYKNKWVRILILAAGCLMTLYSFVFQSQVIENQQMTTLFIGVSLIIYGFASLFSKKISTLPGFSPILTYLGQNTLLFYWVHLFILFNINFRWNAMYMWLFIFLSSICLMLFLQKINSFTFGRISENILFWVSIIILTFLPLVFSNSLKFNFYFLSAITIIFALNYHNFFKLPVFKK